MYILNLNNFYENQLLKSQLVAITITLTIMTCFEVLESVSYLLGLIDAHEWETFRSYALEPSPAHFQARTNV
jgi:hypothetical protein